MFLLIVVLLAPNKPRVEFTSSLFRLPTTTTTTTTTTTHISSRRPS